MLCWHRDGRSAVSRPPASQSQLCAATTAPGLRTRVETDDYELVEVGSDRLESSETQIVTSAYSILLEGKRYLVKVSMDTLSRSHREDTEMHQEALPFKATFEAVPVSLCPL